MLKCKDCERDAIIEFLKVPFCQHHFNIQIKVTMESILKDTFLVQLLVDRVTRQKLSTEEGEKK